MTSLKIKMNIWKDKFYSQLFCDFIIASFFTSGFITITMQVSKDKVNNLTNLYKFIQIKTDGKGQIRIIICT